MSNDAFNVEESSKKENPGFIENTGIKFIDIFLMVCAFIGFGYSSFAAIDFFFDDFDSHSAYSQDE